MTCSARRGPGAVLAVTGLIEPVKFEQLCDRIAAVAIAVQESLFECNERRSLGSGAWIDIRSGWLTGADELLGELLETIPWRAERRQMYDRVLDVPRLVSFHDLTVERRTASSSWPGFGGGSTTSTPANSASRSPPSACAGIATGPTAWRGTATPSAAAAPRTPWWRSSASAPPAPSRCGPAAAARRCGCRRRTAICW